MTGATGATGATGMAAVGATYSATAASVSTTGYTQVNTVSLNRTIGSSGTAIVTISADVGIGSGTTASNYCLLAFAGANTGQATAADTYAMKTITAAAPAATTQVFYMTGLTAGSTGAFSLYMRSSATAATCKINEVTLMVMSP